MRGVPKPNLKVYSGMFDGCHAYCLATTSMKRVQTLLTMEGLNASLTYLQNYCTVTGNDRQIEVASAEPGVLFREATPGKADYARYRDLNARSKFGYDHMVEMEQIRTSLRSSNLGAAELHFEAIRIYEDRHKNGETYKQKSERRRLEARARLDALPRGKLNNDEVAYLIEKLTGVNDPVGQSAREVLQRMVK